MHTFLRLFTRWRASLANFAVIAVLVALLSWMSHGRHDVVTLIMQIVESGLASAAILRSLPEAARSAGPGDQGIELTWEVRQQFRATVSSAQLTQAITGDRATRPAATPGERRLAAVPGFRMAAALGPAGGDLDALLASHEPQAPVGVRTRTVLEARRLPTRPSPPDDAR